jgi:hypothetical protein
MFFDVATSVVANGITGIYANGMRQFESASARRV